MTAETSNARGEWVLVPREVVDFLMGEGELQGAWFGETPTGERGQWFWRKHLRHAKDAAPPPAAARGDVRDVLEKAAWGLYVAWDAVAALEDLQKRGVYAPRCADGKPSRADAGKDLEVIKAAYETVKQALAAEGVQAGEVEQRSPDVAMALHWIDRYAGGIDDDCQIDLVAEALGVTLPDGYGLSQQPEARGVVDELLVNIRRACDRARNSLPLIPANSGILASLDHIENLAQEARAALTEARNE